MLEPNVTLQSKSLPTADLAGVASIEPPAIVDERRWRMVHLSFGRPSQGEQENHVADRRFGLFITISSYVYRGTWSAVAGATVWSRHICFCVCRRRQRQALWDYSRQAAIRQLGGFCFALFFSKPTHTSEKLNCSIAAVAFGSPLWKLMWFKYFIYT